jgi:hypothetical protein
MTCWQADEWVLFKVGIALSCVQGKLEDALQAFAEDVYHCACEYGPQDVRTSLGYYNLSKVLAEAGNSAGAVSCSEMVVNIWCTALQAVVLGVAADSGSTSSSSSSGGSGSSNKGSRELPVGRLQLLEVVDMLQVGGNKLFAVLPGC